MSEKKGNTVKLKYDFPSYLCCEVYIPNLGWWHRITPKEFRSWCGQRRLLKFKGEFGTAERESYYEDYDGPTYLYDSNKKINPSKYIQNKVAFLHEKDPRKFVPRNGRERDYVHQVKAEAARKGDDE